MEGRYRYPTKGSVKGFLKGSVIRIVIMGPISWGSKGSVNRHHMGPIDIDMRGDTYERCERYVLYLLTDPLLI